MGAGILPVTLHYGTLFLLFGKKNLVANGRISEGLLKISLKVHLIQQ